MNKLKILGSFLILFFLIQSVQSQGKLVGLWEIEKVLVGEKNMTPIAKWTRINSDGTYQSGNGWLQNAVGKWTFDSQKAQFLPIETEGLENPFGPFIVDFDSLNQMTWLRMEEGIPVKVSLKKVTKLPQSPADRIVGLWDLENTNSEVETNQNRLLFIRWDRIYREFTQEGSNGSGYWHMHGHKAEVTLLPHTAGKSPESWKVGFEEGQLILTGISDSNRDKQLRFSRRTSFPD